MNVLSGMHRLMHKVVSVNLWYCKESPLLRSSQFFYEDYLSFTECGVTDSVKPYYL